MLRTGSTLNWHQICDQFLYTSITISLLFQNTFDITVNSEQPDKQILKEQKKLRRQLETRGLKSVKVLDAIQHTRRDLCVPEHLRDRAYDDDALPIGLNQTISQPYIVALMTESLDLTGDELVLEVGTGSGYQAAILSQLCREVVTIERIGELSHRAQQFLVNLGVDNIDFRIGDGTLGCPDRAPFDGILVTAATPEVPAQLLDQLADGGRLIAPVGPSDVQMLQCIQRQADTLCVRDVCSCRFVKLIGQAAWPET